MMPRLIAMMIAMMPRLSRLIAAMRVIVMMIVLPLRWRRSLCIMMILRHQPQ